jgi:hypothetical protein
MYKNIKVIFQDLLKLFGFEEEMTTWRIKYTFICNQTWLQKQYWKN